MMHVPSPCIMFANLFFALREMGVTVAVLFMIVLRLPAYACILLRLPASRRDRRATCATVCDLDEIFILPTNQQRLPPHKVL
jgi:hypothetical protein